VSRAQLIVTAVTLQGLTQAEAARAYGLSESRVSRIMARWRAEGDAAFEPGSRRPKTTPTATPQATIELIVNLRANLAGRGLDHGPATIAWHLQHHHGITVSRATIARILTRQGLVTPAPKKRPRSSYLRFEADLPNECWQSDFTHWRLTDGTDAEILTFLDDCTRYAISVTAHRRVTTPDVLAAFRAATARTGPSPSTRPRQPATGPCRKPRPARTATPTRPTESAATASTKPAASRCASTANSATSPSAEPTHEPASCSSSTTSTSPSSESAWFSFRP